MEYNEVLYLLLVNFFLGAVALIIKSNILADYWPREDKYGLQYENDIIRREKRKKIILNLSLGFLFFIGVIFARLMLCFHPNPKGK